MVFLITIATFVIIAFSGRLGIIDLSPLTVICSAAWGGLAASSICYFRKAQAENVIKISKQIQFENIDIQNVQVANEVMNSNFSNNM